MGSPFRFGFLPPDHSGNFYQMPKLHFTIRATSIAFYHSGKLDETGGRKTRLPSLAGELCMERPAHRRSSPMEPAKRLNRLAQQHCDAFSERGLWRCECTESEQKSTKTTGLCVADLDGGRARREDNRRPRMLDRVRPHRASCSPGGGRPSSPPERHAQGQA